MLHFLVKKKKSQTVDRMEIKCCSRLVFCFSARHSHWLYTYFVTAAALFFRFETIIYEMNWFMDFAFKPGISLWAVIVSTLLLVSQLP